MELPPELIQEILSFVDNCTLLTVVVFVCKRWRMAARQSARLGDFSLLPFAANEGAVAAVRGVYKLAASPHQLRVLRLPQLVDPTRDSKVSTDVISTITQFKHLRTLDFGGLRLLFRSFDSSLEWEKIPLMVPFIEYLRLPTSDPWGEHIMVKSLNLFLSLSKLDIRALAAVIQPTSYIELTRLTSLKTCSLAWAQHDKFPVWFPELRQLIVGQRPNDTLSPVGLGNYKIPKCLKAIERLTKLSEFRIDKVHTLEFTMNLPMHLTSLGVALDPSQDYANLLPFIASRFTALRSLHMRSYQDFDNHVESLAINFTSLVDLSLVFASSDPTSVANLQALSSMKSLRSVKAKQCHADQPAVEFPPGSIEENAELLQQTLQALPPSLETIFSWSKLGLACLSGDKVLAEEFIGSCPLEHKKEFSNFHPLFAAVTANSPDVVKLLLSHGANPNIRDESYCTPLMRAAEKKHNDCVLELLRCPRCQVDAIDLRGRTALFYAMRDVDTSLAKMLIAAGANVNHTSRQPQSRPIFESVHPEMVSLLHESGASLEIPPTAHFHKRLIAGGSPTTLKRAVELGMVVPKDVPITDVFPFFAVDETIWGFLDCLVDAGWNIDAVDPETKMTLSEQMRLHYGVGNHPVHAWRERRGINSKARDSSEDSEPMDEE